MENYAPCTVEHWQVFSVGGRIIQLRVGRNVEFRVEPVENWRRGVQRGRLPNRSRAGARIWGEWHKRGDQDIFGCGGKQR